MKSGKARQAAKDAEALSPIYEWPKSIEHLARQAQLNEPEIAVIEEAGAVYFVGASGLRQEADLTNTTCFRASYHAALNVEKILELRKSTTGESNVQSKCGTQ